MRQGYTGKRRTSETAYLAEGIEDVIEINEDFALCDLGNVIHGLAGIVSDSCILVCEAS